jgi:selenide,water dikinase
VIEQQTETNGRVRLTQQVKAGGCASKLPPGSLRAVLDRLPRQSDPNLLVGFETADDAGIYRVAPDLALVQTVDFFTPMVDDPFTFGRIAATNALSDVYAMGGRPATALSLVCFPEAGDLGTLEQIMRGGLAAMEEAGCVVAGGHSVRDPEMKFGYAVTGLIDPEHIFTNAGARRGDALVFTKRIGTGVITTALKQGKCRPEWERAAVESMTASNRAASEVVTAGGFAVHAMTDVTGFGLMGHGREMAMASGVRLLIETGRVNLLEGAIEAARVGAIPGGLISNREFAECFVEEAGEIAPEVRALMFDPQTSGGLLISVAVEDAEGLVAALRNVGVEWAGVIGAVVGGEPKIELR